MSVHKRTLPSGAVRWDVRIRGLDRKERQKTFKTKKEADAWEREQLTRKSSGKTILVPGKGETLRTVWSAWRNRPGLATGTVQAHDVSEKMMEPLLDIPVIEITKDVISYWYNQLLTGRPWIGKDDAGVRRQTARGYLGHLVGALRLAADQELITAVPQIPKPDRLTAPSPISIRDIPSAKEVKVVTDFLYGGGMGKDGIFHRPSAVLGDMVSLISITGLRLGEACGLTIQDIDEETRTINVDKQIVGNHPKRIHTPIKTGSSGVRVVPYPKEADALIRGIIARAEAQRKTGEPDHIFRSSRKVPFSSQIASTMIRRATVACGYTWRAHALRHRYASMLLTGKNPLSLVEVSHLLGHSSPQTTARVYAHVITGHSEHIPKSLSTEYKKMYGDPEEAGSFTEGVDYEVVDGQVVRLDDFDDHP